MTRAPQRAGTLYLVATPIGNLEDITRRAVRILGEVDVVAAEDTRRTRKLLAALGISKPLESLHADSGARKVERIVELLRGGKDVALTSDAGTPLIADPGADLVQACNEAGIAVVAVPGPSAVAAAIAVAGFGGDRFLFAGYPPRKAGERRQFLERIAAMPYPVVLFEVPHRVVQTLQQLSSILGCERQVVVCRELTKLHEEVVRGAAVQVAAAFEHREPKGEFTIVIAAGRQASGPPVAGDPRAAAALMAQMGLSSRQITDVLVAAAGLGRNEAYRLALQARESKDEVSGSG